MRPIEKPLGEKIEDKRFRSQLVHVLRVVIKNQSFSMQSADGVKFFQTRTAIGHSLISSSHGQRPPQMHVGDSPILL